jgi:hypothetical protein
MRFRIPTAALADVVRSQNVRLNVGGVQELLQPDHLEALRDLLSRVGGVRRAVAVGGRGLRGIE